ncbi:hypothetical protein K493DRAFT_350076 [Basidiobolus meristosporus CBS 931.73]|uniref:Histone deacetylase complex subunit SAP30 Sin3 binding domain-containing protein n=1 Tax=Basidiobolus meristosporus CBS 931.73 TaxID=1314790 RepID=A0A1Y1YHC2_9FUNG|nr:hypothetical protein K493DRAFT_350076 [Basidiobolus meristosporus CBS 931.73]|eukprot:ORX97420.1 hypothetical protein K493DRAFT_350076 [Basidiobolus meristosporus CBS 931.73]
MAAKTKSTKSSTKSRSRGKDKDKEEKKLVSPRKNESGLEAEAQPKLDFEGFNMNILRKYRRVFKVNVKSRSNRAELVAAVSKHFASQTLNEHEAISLFLYSVHNRDKILKLPPSAVSTEQC